MAVISKSQLADELGVSRARVSQYVNEGLPTLSSGKLDRDAALNWITGNIIPVDYESDKGTMRAARLLKGDEAAVNYSSGPPVGWLRPVHEAENPFDKGVLFAMLTLVRDIGAIAAVAAHDAGATIATAKMVESTMAVMFVEIASDLMRENRIGPFERDDEPAIWPRERGMRVDWKRVAEDAGEPYEPKKWEAYAKHRKAALARECEAIEGADAARSRKGGARKASRSSR